MNGYNPDILSCLSNLSNDEVYTPPSLANKMLDLLPNDLWSNSKAKFLDPVSKSGVFLREIAKRLMVGLEQEIPDKHQRANHIFTTQLYGIAITELTSLLSRRTVYCSKTANGKYSVCEEFKDNQGNIIFNRIKHTWDRNHCMYCGASKEVYDRGDDLETYAYPFIHTYEPEKLFNNMTFDVIIGNPPYQLSFGIEGSNSSNAQSIYNLFIEQSIKLHPKYLSMITLSRWMTKTSQGIADTWVDEMLRSNKFKIFHDFETSAECFPGLNALKGGVSYFLWDRDYKGKCDYYYHNKDGEIYHRFDYLDPNNTGIVIRDPESYDIINKIVEIEGLYYKDLLKNFSGLVSPKHFFDNSELLTSNWKEYKTRKNEIYNIKYYLNKVTHKIDYAWISEEQIPKNKNTMKLNKIYIPTTGGSGYDSQILGMPFYGEPNSICSQTYLIIGYNPKIHNFTKKQCENIIYYIKTKFFRYLVSIKKKTQNAPRGVYQFVPLQDFNEEWIDEKLYKKYKLDEKEIAFIESMIKPME